MNPFKDWNIGIVADWEKWIKFLFEIFFSYLIISSFQNKIAYPPEHRGARPCSVLKISEQDRLYIREQVRQFYWQAIY